MPTDPSRIRNFSIIAHIDHGKSTLADRILEYTGALSSRELVAQFLDKMDIERERGITIKAQHVRIGYLADDGVTYQVNLIDTPGHVDFTYEVSRSLQACEGALLVVDATQGVEAQTLANVYLAVEANLEVIPVLNKVDLPSADTDRTRAEIEDVVGLDCSKAILASGKTGIGIRDILEAVVARVKPPKGDPAAPLKALLFDSWYDSYRGAVVVLRVIEGTLRKGDKIYFMATQREYEVVEMGVFTPHAISLDELGPGEVGFVAANVRSVHDTKIGDTVTHPKRRCEAPLPGFKDVKPMVFAGIYPTDSSDYPNLRDALEKLRLNDASFRFEPDTSEALGFGFRCGFLGLLHMEIIQERLEREYNHDLIITAPSVVYKVRLKNGETVDVENPARLPDAGRIDVIEEPFLKLTLHTPVAAVGAIMQLCQDRRGVQVGMQYVGTERVILTYEMPLNEVVFDFFDKLKSSSKGYASMDYELLGYREGSLVRVDLMVNGEAVDALTVIIHKEKAHKRGRELAEKLKEVIHRQQYEVAIQAAIGGKVIAR